MWLFSSNKSLVQQRRAARDALIDDARTALGSAPHADSSAILSSNIVDIVKGIQERRWTSTTVVQAFIRQAILAHEKTNCLTEVNFATALDRARELDEEFNKTGQIVGPLHGIPFSLKDHYALKGKQSVTGYTEWFKVEPSQEDGALARISQHLGAVCIAKTNVPQTMLNFECRNPAWGQTDNPYNSDYTAGGSSGGEAALLAAGGSAFGFGSDIGGSLRIPTSYCGIYALKPSNGRSWPREGNIDVGPSPSAIASVAGPMCRSLSDLSLLMRLFTDTLNPPIDSPESPRELQLRFGTEILPSIPLRPAWLEPTKAFTQLQAEGTQQTKPLRIGYYLCDGLTQTSPAGLRAMRIAIDALRKTYPNSGSGSNVRVELVEIAPSKLDTFKTLRAFVGLTSITAYDHLKRHLGPDRVDRALLVALLLPAMPVVRFFVRLVIRFVMRDRFVSHLLTHANGKTAARYFAYEKDKRDLVRAFEKRIWNEMKLDAIIAPVQASPALPHYGSTLLAPLAGSTILYNVLGNPATVVPVTRVEAIKDSTELLQGSSSNRRELVLWNKQPGAQECSPLVASNMKKQYNAKRQAGLPIGVQVVTREYEDEKSIGIAQLLDEALAAYDAKHRVSFGPGAWDRYCEVSK